MSTQKETVIIKPCTHNDKTYAVGDVVKDAKVAKALIAAGVAT